MANENKDIVKRRILVLLRMFYELTDEDHPMSTDQIIEYLQSCGVGSNKKTLRSDIALLEESGLDIVTITSKPNRYFWGDRGFELPELKLLIDAVSSSRFITQKKSTELVGKLSALASEPQRQELKRNVYATERVKSANERIYYTVDTINNAINQERQISFQYTEYTADKKVVLRNDGEVYVLSPYALFWNEDFYYVIGWSDKHENVSAFRVDRMHRPTILEEPAVPRPEDFRLEDYSRRIFEMYDGEAVTVRLECKDYLMKYVVDRFGEDVKVRPSQKGQFIVTADVQLSPNFYAWIFRFGGDMRIISPDHARREMVGMLRSMLEAEEL